MAVRMKGGRLGAAVPSTLTAAVPPRRWDRFPCNSVRDRLGHDPRMRRRKLIAGLAGTWRRGRYRRRRSRCHNPLFGYAPGPAVSVALLRRAGEVIE